MRSLALAATIFLLSSTLSYAQQFDPAFGLSGLTAPSASSAATSTTYQPQAISGGVFPSVSGDFLFTKFHVGVNGNVAWRGGQANYEPLLYGNTLPYRPIFYTFNGIFAPQLNKRITLEMYGGLGGESTRFYGTVNCSFAGCTNYTSTHHLLGDVGGGVRFYLWNRLFVRPEAQVYFVRHNFEFSGATATRAGISVGYTFGNR